VPALVSWFVIPVPQILELIGVRKSAGRKVSAAIDLCECRAYAEAKAPMTKHPFFYHPDFNRRCWNFTSSTAKPRSRFSVAILLLLPLLAACRVADFNRRFRFSLTPKNVYNFVIMADNPENRQSFLQIRL
jgi:hypothetical protein